MNPFENDEVEDTDPVVSKTVSKNKQAGSVSTDVVSLTCSVLDLAHIWLLSISSKLP